MTNREKMTSKESLQHIINLVSDDTYYRDALEEEFEILQRDLEVLDILKNILKIKKSGLYGYEIIVRGSDEQENKIKEWLEK